MTPSRPIAAFLLLLLAATAHGRGGHSAPGRARHAETRALPEPSREGGERGLAVEDALARRRSVREFAGDALPVAALSQLLWAAQGITGSRGRRTAPSAGALYPLELYVVAGSVAGLPAGVYRYEPRGHELVAHSRGDLRQALAGSALKQDWVARAPAVLVIGAVHARSARKYGKRAPRYVHMEVGHAAQNVYLQAVALGLGTVAVGAFRDGRLHGELGLPEEVAPLLLMPVGIPAS